ncbi:ATP-binding cassette domain-containing protein [Rhodocytophaga rosea]|uniref:ATP-binding cassette domain-containing protein n=1 Tax=Rhodocytophaga rosea TaxID=2704465 RepID=A0A6C0GTT6_9BACT|nr:ATP-binding cassette domain-containing protein [Rhodocytophaga rosea]QHT71224.1 ATP-binding cassette domain-containing protein [Rhodocytophaga rosea]
MNEQVLIAIVKLLAISVKIDGVLAAERDRIRRFMKAMVEDDHQSRFMTLFDEYVTLPPTGIEEIRRICDQINAELQFKQKLIVVLRLIELSLTDEHLSDDEDEFTRTVCQELNIDENIYHSLLRFVQIRDVYQIQVKDILIIDDEQPKTASPEDNHIHNPRLGAVLAILRLPEVDMYFLKAATRNKHLFLNGSQLPEDYISPLASGTIIKATNGETIYYSDIIGHFLRLKQKPQISFVARNIDYYFRSGKKGLHQVQVEEESGRLVALMGSSGSGKSTLLNVLNGNYKPQRGEVLINGINIHTHPEEVEGVIGYVPQADLLIEDLTVYQNLYYAAKLCFGDYSESKIAKLVLQTLDSLGLDEIKHLKVGSVLEKTISGGQRKRLNIGLELLRQPSVLFVDEPTSGLSSRDSENILDLLRELTMLGKLIFVVIHQPSSDLFKMFDRLIIMDTGGYQVYYGNPLEAINYFKSLTSHISRLQRACVECGNVNAEQIFNIIDSRTVDEYGRSTNQRKVLPATWHTFFKDRIDIKPVTEVKEKPVHTLNVPSRWKQFRVFVSRDLLAKLSNRQYMVINLVQAPLLAFILAYVVKYFRIDELTGGGNYVFSENVNVPTYMFMSIIVSLFMGLTISAEEIIKDASILKREAFLHLSRNSYLLSKVCVLFGFSAIQTLTFTLIGNWVTEVEGLTFLYWMVLFSCSCFANLLGLNISSTFNSVITIYILIPVLLIPQLVLSGIVVKFDEINPRIYKPGNVPFLADLMASRWAYEAIMVSQFMYNAYEKEYYPLDRQIAEADYKKTYYLPTLFSKLDYCVNISGNSDKLADKEFREDLQVLQNEIKQEMRTTPSITFAGIGSLTPQAFNYQLGNQVRAYLEKVRLHYVNMSNKATATKDSLVGVQVKTPEDRERYLARRSTYYNETVEKLVTNNTAEDRIVEFQGKLMQKIYPVYLYPLPKNELLDTKAHFFAPVKYAFGRYVPTLYFNLGIVWLMTGLLYLTLYFKAFRLLVGGDAKQRKKAEVKEN